MTTQLSELQHRALQCLLEADQSLTIRELARAVGVDQAQVAALVHQAGEQGWIDISETRKRELSLAAGAEPVVASGLPERRFLEHLAGEEGLAMREAAARARELGVALNEVLRWGSSRGWWEKQGGELRLLEAGSAARQQPQADERALDLLASEGALFLEDLEARGLDGDEVERLLKNRSNVARIKVRTFRSLTLTPAGRQVLAGPLTVRRQQSQLSSEDITSGRWREIDLKPYDVTLPAEVAVPVKAHPFQRVLEQTRRVFLEMGFSEIVSPMVETAFWNFDALFQPQDHPARDMQDTFYMSRPATGRLPDPEVVERVQRTHEDGWETGSRGWGYRWSEKRARQMVLRTHTTASTIRALAADPRPPRKVFCVGRVFRNETITYKHLPEFTQIDGIIIDEQASFATLLGTLKEFYRKMGFARVRFKPGFFPYTEPSAEVFGWMESKQSWIELGGSGVFRPEVTRPLGCEVPVLAWGLGLERLAMFRYGTEDIRTLYWTDQQWLEEVPLCQ